MIHLIKQTSVTVNGRKQAILACVNSAFIRGAVRTADQFAEALESKPTSCCKKCTAIFNKLK